VPERTVIFTTHNMDEAERVCDRVGIIDRGKMLVCDRPDNLKKSVGDGDVLEITAGGIKNKKKLENKLKKSLGKGLRGITFIENRLILRTPDGARQLPAITEIMKKEKVDIEDIRFRWNTLEDVFINLTGRSLRQ
jgi:ABC-2 type transport system ATP-binding protein